MSNILLICITVLAVSLIVTSLIWFVKLPYRNIDKAIKSQLISRELLFKNNLLWYDYENKIKVDHPPVGLVVEAYCHQLGKWVKAECIRRGDGKSGFLNDAYFALDNIGQLFFSEKSRPLDWDKNHK